MTAMRLHRYPSPSGGIALGKMGVGATMLKQGKTARDYVQDSLVAMWDGIENAGWGVHDASASGWLDLIGGKFATFSGGIVHDTYWEPNKNNASFDGTLFGSEFTVEFIFDGIAANAGTFATPLTNSQDTYSFFRRNGQYWEFKLAGAAGRSRLIPFELKPFWFSQNTTTGTACGYYTGECDILNSTVGATTGPVSATWQIGGNSIGPNRFLGNGARYFALRIYNRVLTPAEIAANYAIDKERFNLP